MKHRLGSNSSGTTLPRAWHAFLRRACAVLMLLIVPASAQATITPADLRCEYGVAPVAIDTPKPRLGWVLLSGERAQRQSAYRIVVASSQATLAKDEGDLWDSGRVRSSAQNQIPYAGKPLQPHQICYWKVRVWDQDHRPSNWSEPSAWTVGPGSEPDWPARWITQDPPNAPPSGQSGPLPLFRREFNVAKPVGRAVVHICGLGFYELRLNGGKVGNHELDPGWTNYRKRCLYASYDVTGQLRLGTNAIGVMLGNGMYHVPGGRYVKFTGSFGPPKLILQLRLQYADGTVDTIGTDDAWRTASGPITFSCIFGGEDYDARREQPGWDLPGFDARSWSPAQMTDGPGGELAAQTAPPLKTMRIYSPIRVTEPRPGIYTFDLGQNFSGWPSLTVSGPRGAVVKLVPGELLDEEGLVTQRSSGGPVSFSYTLKGHGAETWHPRFTYYGFRYVQVEGAVRASAAVDRGTPLLQELEGHCVHSSANRVGRFECSNPLINRIHALILRAIESNLQSVLTDCPHREKLGWLEVSHLLGPAIMFNYDVPQLYRKICDDMRESQLANGLVPDIAPEYVVFNGGFRDSPEWGSAVVMNPWWLYEFYGDREALQRYHPAMRRYVDYLGTRASGQIVSHGLGDWYDIGPNPPGESQLTSRGLTATAIYYQDLRTLEAVAERLQQSTEAAVYRTRANRVRDAFNDRFFSSAAKTYDRGSQTAQAMPLVLGIAPESDQGAVLSNLVATVRTNQNRVTAGDVGFAYLIRALTQAGRDDVLLDLVTQTNGPGYADQLDKGATALTEAWDANPASSQNHCMLGHAGEWFYRGLAGINPHPAGPGFERVMIRPSVVGDLTWVSAHYDSLRGRIESAWERNADRTIFRFTLPPNTTATVVLPVSDPETVRESGRRLRRTRGARIIQSTTDKLVLELDSGRYEFETQSPPR